MSSLSVPRDLGELGRVCREVNAALTLLDPLLSRLDASLDSHKDAEVRRALEPLVALADATDTAVVGILHVNKSSSTDPLTTLMASRAFAAVARSVLFVMVDPDDEQRRLLGQPKNNLGKSDLPTLAFRIVGERVAETAEGEVWTGRLQWDGESDRSIREALQATVEASGDKTAAAEAAEWLEDFLSSHDGAVESALAKREGGRAGHSPDALKRARRKLGLEAKSIGFPRRTYWRLPQSEQPVGASALETSITALTAPTEPHQGQSEQSEQSEQSGEAPRDLHQPREW
jgi:hypothetical protein